MHKHLTALFLVCISFTALAGDSNEHWLEVQSPHFVVLTDTNEKQARRIAGQFEHMRAIFHMLLPNASDNAGAPIIVVALKDKKGFQALEPPAYLAKNQLDLAGLFINSPDKNYILLRLDAQGENPFSTVYHEYTHYMMRKSTWTPLWLNEGLAEFYQNTEIRDKDVVLGQPSPDDILYLRQNKLLPLTTLLSVDHSSPYYHDEQKGSVFYAESWALTHYLVVNDYQKKTHLLTDYARFLTKGEDSVTAAQHAFGDLKRLQDLLDNYVQQSSFTMFKMNAAVPIDVATFDVRPVSNSEADAVRADVLIHDDRAKEAQALLETTLRDDPNNALAHETMGYLKFRDQDIPAARKWYGEAVQLDSHSYLAHYYFAVMTLQSGDTSHDAEIESSFRTSIKLNPSFAPSYDALANFYASRDQKLDEAHILNIEAIQLEPANVYYRLNAANVLSQQREYLSAINVLKLALPIAKTQTETNMVQSRIHSLEQFQAALESNNTQSGTQSTTSQASTQTGAAPPDAKKTTVFQRVDGKLIGMTEETPNYPTGDATGPQHTIKGVLTHIRCSYPNVLALSMDQAGKTLTFYNNNYYKVVFTTANYEPKGDIKPCTEIEGMKATVKYAEVTDKVVAGQILSIELSK
jgi:tetratricopeptide (TPR) repeat protein